MKPTVVQKLSDGAYFNKHNLLGSEKEGLIAKLVINMYPVQTDRLESIYLSLSADTMAV